MASRRTRVIDPREIAAVQRAVERAGKRFVDNGHEAMQRAGRRILVSALETVPVDEGDLKASGEVEQDAEGTTIRFGGGEQWYAQVASAEPGVLEPGHYLYDSAAAEVETWPDALARDMRRRK